MLSFMDDFSSYNQILMPLKNVEKTSFITEWGIYCITKKRFSKTIKMEGENEIPKK